MSGADYETERNIVRHKIKYLKMPGDTIKLYNMIWDTLTCDMCDVNCEIEVNIQADIWFFSILRYTTLYTLKQVRQANIQ